MRRRLRHEPWAMGPAADHHPIRAGFIQRAVTSTERCNIAISDDGRLIASFTVPDEFSIRCLNTSGCAYGQWMVIILVPTFSCNLGELRRVVMVPAMRLQRDGDLHRFRRRFRIRSAGPSSRISAEPAMPFTTFFTGQPKIDVDNISAAIFVQLRRHLPNLGVAPALAAPKGAPSARCATCAPIPRFASFARNHFETTARQMISPAPGTANPKPRHRRRMALSVNVALPIG